MQYNKELNIGEFEIEYVLNKYVIPIEICELDNKKSKYKFKKLRLKKYTSKSEVGIDGKIYPVHINSQRYELFKSQGYTCVVCGITANVAVLTKELNGRRAHFDFYYKKGNNYTLFTKDHIIPKSLGGKNLLSNYQPMCSFCNEEKGNSRKS